MSKEAASELAASIFLSALVVCATALIIHFFEGYILAIGIWGAIGLGILMAVAIRSKDRDPPNTNS